MDLRTRVTLLSESADRDGSGGAAVGPGSAFTRPGDPVGITKVRYPGQGVTRLMRVMQTNACSLSCGYCPTFCGGKVRRTYLQPEEIAVARCDLSGLEGSDHAAIKLAEKGGVGVRCDRSCLASYIFFFRDQGLRQTNDPAEFKTSYEAHAVDHVHTEIAQRTETSESNIIAP